MKRIFTVFMAIAMVFSLFTLSVFADSAYDDGIVGNVDYNISATVTSSYASTSISASCSGGTVQVESMCAAETLNGDWVVDYHTSGTSGSISNSVSVSGSNFIGACTEHHIYENGSYVDTVGIDIYLEEDI